MNLNFLKSFYLVAKYESFTKAADIEDISKGVLSRNVKSLETSLKAQLFIRTTRSVSLTESGEALYEKCVQIFELLEDAKRRIADLTQEDIGNLTFSCSTSLGDLFSRELIANYSKAMPSVDLKLVFKNEVVDLFHGDFDLAVRAVDKLEDDLVARYLGYVKDTVVMTPSLLAQYSIIRTPKDLLGKPCLLNSHVSRWDTWSFNSGEGEQLNIKVMGTLATNQYTMQRRHTLNSLGIAKLPLYVVEDDIKKGNLVEVLTDFQSWTHPLYIVHAKHNHLPRKIVVFKQLILQWKEKNKHLFISN